MTAGWFWFCVAVLAVTSLFLVGLAWFWGREFGAVGYVYWLSMAAVPLAGIVALGVTVVPQ